MASRACTLAFFLVASGIGACRYVADEGADVPEDVREDAPPDVPTDAPADGTATPDAAACDVLHCATGGECACHNPAKTKVDLLLVLDDSPSMCGVFGQMDRFVTNLVDGAWDAVDLRVAVTTPGACGANRPGELLGAFTRRALDGPAPSCPVRRVHPCLSDADCVLGAIVREWPDPEHWTCEPGPSGTPFACDAPPAGDDPVPDGALHVVESACRYRFDWVGAGGACPADIVPLDGDVVERTLADWKAGRYTGDPAWRGLSDDVVRKLLVAHLLGCLTRIGPSAASCAGPRQGLRAAWEALDPEGPNAAQSRGFLRDGALLLVMILSDQDDCSFADSGPASSPADCACLRDTAGCLPSGYCDPLAPGPLVPPTWLLERLDSLGRRIGLVTFGGDVTPGSATSPTTSAAPIRQRYFDCRCAVEGAPASVYVCDGEGGTAALAGRYKAASVAVWLAHHSGAFANLCDPVWTDPWPW
jgi:hypothetical protein